MKENFTGIVLYLLLHFFADFIFQIRATENENIESFKLLMLHCVFYTIPFVVLSFVLIVFNTKIVYSLILLLLIPGTHLIIDIINFCINKVICKRNQHLERLKAVYVTDQLLHVGSIILLYKYYFSQFDYVFPFNLGFSEFITLLLYCVILLKPANVTFDNMFFTYKPANSSSKGYKGAGALIGNLERLICGVFLLKQQYAAIGLTMTAKSMARYKLITENQKFSEYYIIGTLFSLLYTIFAYAFVYKALPQLTLT